MEECVVLHTALPQVLARLQTVMVVYSAGNIAQVVVFYSAVSIAQVVVFFTWREGVSKPYVFSSLFLSLTRSMKYFPLK